MKDLSPLQRRVLKAAPFFGPSPDWQGVDLADLTRDDWQPLVERKLLIGWRLAFAADGWVKTIVTRRRVPAADLPYLPTHRWDLTSAGAAAVGRYPPFGRAVDRVVAYVEERLLNRGLYLDQARSWMLAADPLLGGDRPYDLICEGRVDAVIEAARQMAEAGYDRLRAERGLGSDNLWPKQDAPS